MAPEHRRFLREEDSAEEIEALSSRERTCLESLLASYGRLLMNEAGRVDTQSEKGASVCGKFLRALERMAHVLDLTPAPRTYREHFTLNYRAIFDCETRDYRADILEAGTTLVQHPVIWANGESYQISDVALRCSEKVLEAWSELCELLDAFTSLGDAPSPPQLASFVSCLNNFDVAWACFECVYITELMKVQERARCLVSEAAEAERRLSLLEMAHAAAELAELHQYQAEKRVLVAYVGRLNSVANFQRKGRDDLSVGILDAAVDLLSRCSSMQPAGGRALSPARVLAEQVVEAFEDVRDYLHEVQHHLDTLHLHLCENPGLVSRLVRWEETWEIGARYLHSEEVLSALCHLVPQLQRACRIAPELAEMCENRDAEFFLVLPRLVWLCLLADPAKPSELVRRLLPHRFSLRAGAPTAAVAGSPPCLSRRHSDPDLPAAAELARAERVPWMGPELQAVTEKFWRAELLLGRALPEGGPLAWEVLARRAVVGTSAAADPYACLEEASRDEAAAAAEDLMHELEGWSMELQRHCPEDWNECINVLVQCLGKSQRSESSV